MHKTSKVIIFPPAYPSSRSRVAGATHSSSGPTAAPRPGQDALSSQGHSGRDNSERPAHLTGTALGCGSKPEPPEKRTQIWGEHALSIHMVVPAGNLLFFPHQCCNKTKFNQLTLFEDVLHIILHEVIQRHTTIV